MKRNAYYVILLALGLLALAGCTLKPEGWGETQEGTGVNTASIRTFDQMFESLSRATGITASNGAVTSAFASVKPRLSMDGSAQSVSPSMLLASTALTGVFCGQFIDAEAALPAGSRRVHAAVDFTKGPSLFNEDARRNVINRYAQIFWQRDATEEETEALLTSLTEAGVGSADNGGTTKVILRIACSAAGSSLAAVSH